MKRLEDERRHYLVMLEQKKADLQQKRLLQQGRYTCWFKKYFVYCSYDQGLIQL